MNDIPILDYEEFLDRIGGETDFAIELLTEFCEGLPGDIESLKDSLENGNLEEIVLKAHTLKGSAANLSAKAFSRAAKAIEEASRENNLETAQSGLSLLDREAGRLREHFATLKSAD